MMRAARVGPSPDRPRGPATKTVPAGSPGEANDFTNWKTANGFNPVDEPG
jgi:hypothetical protein